MKFTSILFAFIAIIFLVSCSHNPALFTMGKRFQAGTTPGSADLGLSYTNGLSIIDIPRENSSWEMEIADDEGLSFDSTTNTLRGVRKITRKTGIQITGYLVDLAEKSPEAAKAYIEQASEIQKVDGVKLSPQLVTLPLSQSNGNTITKYLLSKIKAKVEDPANPITTVPEGLNMSLYDWKFLVESYKDCPECLSLSKVEADALEKETGIKYPGTTY